MLITNTAVQEAALTLAQRLTLADPTTGTWAVDPEAPADGAAHLIHDDGRGLSFRPVFGGTTAQIWITGAPAPSIPTDATPAEQDAHQAQLALRLAAGHRYNRAITLLTEDDDVDPADLILDTVENHLLPAFTLKPHYVGHRPWDDLFAEALNETKEEAATPVGTSLRDCGPEAHTQPPAEPDDEPTPDPAPAVNVDVADTSETPTEPGDDDRTPTAPDPQQPADTAPTSDDQEPQTEQATTDSAALRPAAKRRPSNRASAKKPRPKITP
ncbi:MULTISPECIES: hypothetical protein [unclassified Streptomyces]|uniref:hypothetical protein n=1 Tax=unclassified Streptomyces TaxID=2593676 RepID=UPI001E562A52|nr:hypothetical protein [Streptomyces sp. CB02980]MCB8906816.1 hypothetical protein [Streptomyces sp. CB02980]